MGREEWKRSLTTDKKKKKKEVRDISQLKNTLSRVF